MNKLNDFPDISRSLQKMLLQDKLDEINEDTILGFAISNARLNKRPLQEIAETIMSQYNDSPAVVLSVVPQETIDLIKKIYYK